VTGRFMIGLKSDASRREGGVGPPCRGVFFMVSAVPKKGYSAGRRERRRGLGEQSPVRGVVRKTFPEVGLVGGNI